MAKRATRKATKKATKTLASKSRGRSKAVSQLQILKEARKHFAGRVQIMSELDETVPGFISTQSLALDWIVGNGGLPQARIVDITGDEGCGKSTFGDHVIAQVQSMGGHAYLWDTENARDRQYQERIGVLRQKAGLIEAFTLEDGFETMIDLVRFHVEHDPDRPGVIVWDTPAGTPTRAEADADKTNERFGPAKLIREYLRKLNQELRKGRWLLFIVNQTYQKRASSGMTIKVAYGGGGIPYYASVRLTLAYPSKVWRSQRDKDLGAPPVGQRVLAQCLKNKVDRPYRSRWLFIHFGKGVSNSYEVLHTLVNAGLIRVNRGWCQFDKEALPEVAEKYPGSFQASLTHAGHLVLDEMLLADSWLWGKLQEAYRVVMAALDEDSEYEII